MPRGTEVEVTSIFIHRIVGGKIVEEWSEGSGDAEVAQAHLAQERIERERVEQELQVARTIQQASLPEEVPTLEGWQITPYFRPAREVGGDFYEFFELDDGRMGLADRKSTRLNSSHANISYAVFCLKKKIPLQAELDLFLRNGD